MESLNPCFNGRWSASQVQRNLMHCSLIRLNPCFNGRWSASDHVDVIYGSTASLNPCFNGRWSARTENYAPEYLPLSVLILVLMEDGLRVHNPNMADNKIPVS